jgi:glycosyltransferase involved in cell wall biosynthesis
MSQNSGDTPTSALPRVSLVIPARNEADNLFHILPYLIGFDGEVILVDGHSSDDTIEVARLILPSIKVVHQEGRGKGDAIRLGFAACTGDIIVTMDADGSTDPREIPRFVEALLAGFDYAKGSRFLKGGSSSDITWVRRQGNNFLNWVVSLLFHVQFTDLCYGYNAFWRHCLNKVESGADGFEIEAMLTLRAVKAGLSIREVPSNERPRIHGRSNLHAFQDGWRILGTIVGEWRTRDVKSASARKRTTGELVHVAGSQPPHAI